MGSGCGVSKPKERLSTREDVTLDGLSEEQKTIVERLWSEAGFVDDDDRDTYGDEFPGSPASTGSRGSRVSRSSLQSVDFELEGMKILDDKNPLAGTSNLNVIWTHPNSNAKIFVGSERVAHSRQTLIDHGIRRIVVCYDDPNPGPFDGDPDYKYLYFPIGQWKQTKQADSTAGIARLSAPAIGFVESELNEGNNVLIHCLAGAHRAGTTGIICLMYLCNMDSRMATCVAQVARPCIEALAHLSTLLRRFSRSQAAGLAAPAVARAAEIGFQQAALDVFGTCGPLPGPSAMQAGLLKPSIVQASTKTS